MPRGRKPIQDEFTNLPISAACKWARRHKDRHRELVENYRRTHVKETIESTNKSFFKLRNNDPRLYLLRNAKGRAKLKGFDFNLDVEDIVIPTHCPILNIELKQSYGTRKAQDASPSVDRVDNAKGYIKGNIRVISRLANTKKNNLSLEEAKAIVRYMENSF